MSHQRTRLKNLGGNLHIKVIWILNEQQKGNRSIMEECAQILEITAGKLRAINNCRLFLCIITIADLAGLDGKHINFEQIDGKWRADSSLTWPRQCAPTKAQWKLFHWALKKPSVRQAAEEEKHFNL